MGDQPKYPLRLIPPASPEVGDQHPVIDFANNPVCVIRASQTVAQDLIERLNAHQLGLELAANIRRVQRGRSVAADLRAGVEALENIFDRVLQEKDAEIAELKRQLLEGKNENPLHHH